MSEHRNVIDRIEGDWEHGHREQRVDADHPWTPELRGEYMRNTRRFWFQKTPVEIMREDIGIETTPERANEFSSASDSNPEVWYYLGAACSGQPTDEPLKWVMGALAAEASVRGLRFTDIPALMPAGTLRMFSRAIGDGRIDRTFTKVIFAELLKTPLSSVAVKAIYDFEALIDQPRFKAISADDLEPIIDKIIADNLDQFEKARLNPKLVQFFVGQTMRATQGKAPPQKVTEIMQRKLAE